MKCFDLRNWPGYFVACLMLSSFSKGTLLRAYTEDNTAIFSGLGNIDGRLVYVIKHSEIDKCSLEATARYQKELEKISECINMEGCIDGKYVTSLVTDVASACIKYTLETLASVSKAAFLTLSFTLYSDIKYDSTAPLPKNSHPKLRLIGRIEDSQTTEMIDPDIYKLNDVHVVHISPIKKGNHMEL